MWVLFALLGIGIPFILPIASWISIRHLRRRVTDLEQTIEDQARSIELLKRLSRPAPAAAAPTPSVAPPAASPATSDAAPAPPVSTTSAPATAPPVTPKATAPPSPPIER